MARAHRKKYEQRMKVLGLKVAYYRKLKGWTQENLAEKADVTPGYISQIESTSNGQMPSLEMLLTLSEVLEVPPSKLLDDPE